MHSLETTSLCVIDIHNQQPTTIMCRAPGQMFDRSSHCWSAAADIKPPLDSALTPTTYTPLHFTRHRLSTAPHALRSVPEPLCSRPAPVANTQPLMETRCVASTGCYQTNRPDKTPPDSGRRAVARRSPAGRSPVAARVARAPTDGQVAAGTSPPPLPRAPPQPRPLPHPNHVTRDLIRG